MNLADFGRFSDPALLILSSLADEPKHGYGIMTDILAMTGVHLGPGTLLRRSRPPGEVGSHQGVARAKDRRRPYQLTAKGVSALRQQLALLQRARLDWPQAARR